MFEQALYEHLETGLSPTLGAGRVFRGYCAELGDCAVVFDMERERGVIPQRGVCTVRCLARAADDAMTVREKVVGLLDGTNARALGAYALLSMLRSAALRYVPGIERFEATVTFSMSFYDREDN